MNKHQGNNQEGRESEELAAESLVGPDPPRIYVASLSDYNAGRLHGVWLDATGEVEELAEAVAEMLAESAEPFAEETAIHDYQGFGDWHLSEFESLDTVAKVAAGIVEHGPAFAAWVAHQGGLEEDQSFDEAYLGEWRSIEDYSHELTADLGLDISVEPSGWAHYVRFDYPALARDLSHELVSADTADGGVYLFSPWT